MIVCADCSVAGWCLPGDRDVLQEAIWKGGPGGHLKEGTVLGWEGGAELCRDSSREILFFEENNSSGRADEIRRLLKEVHPINKEELGEWGGEWQRWGVGEGDGDGAREGEILGGDGEGEGREERGRGRLLLSEDKDSEEGPETPCLLAGPLVFRSSEKELCAFLRTPVRLWSLSVGRVVPTASGTSAKEDADSELVSFVLCGLFSLHSRLGRPDGPSAKAPQFRQGRLRLWGKVVPSSTPQTDRETRVRGEGVKSLCSAGTKGNGVRGRWAGWGDYGVPDKSLETAWHLFEFYQQGVDEMDDNRPRALSLPDTEGTRRFLSAFLGTLSNRNLKFFDPFFQPTDPEVRVALNSTVTATRRVSDVVCSFEGADPRRVDKRLRGLCSDEPHFTDICQRGLRHCKEVAIWSSLVALRPSVFRDKDIFPLGDTLRESGAVVVRLWIPSLKEWRLFLVDDYLPFKGMGIAYRGERIPCWPAMLVKALWKARGTFEIAEDDRTILGPLQSAEAADSSAKQTADCLRLLDGWISSDRTAEERAESLRRFLLCALEARLPVQVSFNQGGPNQKNVAYHAYGVVGWLRSESDDVEDLILISNPWGEARGDRVVGRFGVWSREWSEFPRVRERITREMLAPGVSLPEGITAENLWQWGGDRFPPRRPSFLGDSFVVRKPPRPSLFAVPISDLSVEADGVQLGARTSHATYTNKLKRTFLMKKGIEGRRKFLVDALLKSNLLKSCQPLMEGMSREDRQAFLSKQIRLSMEKSGLLIEEDLLAVEAAILEQIP
uniref:Calpain catalytic domain-containing protein n=1 Tax=Chromera velia CCMP2878 TaxID=1169474 RepID=A0A0G4FKU1_9ALVE|eukprot:Cvel_17530.t1-p1 / transcript=Cvel_17530.t1 / gene=Cvel_17530 / organism=Chromera_velia_CCMP2878 / gene_product=Calpain-11, putative / transcript_product=Calpain-11, putative / location=Cvel_scaffold1406:111-4456(+) / protein_length=780 / sequence_SO=supercontig / SO=protein_coding / is_pseudo=false